MQSIISWIISIGLILSTVVVHHEALNLVTQQFLPRFKSPRRWHVGATVLILIAAHVVEIVLFATGLYIVCEQLGLGSLSGDVIITFQTYLYFSFASYTSLGLGDLFPLGHLRLLTGMEALLGLLMIGWSASFLLLEMREFWSMGGAAQKFRR